MQPQGFADWWVIFTHSLTGGSFSPSEISLPLRRSSLELHGPIDLSLEQPAGAPLSGHCHERNVVSVGLGCSPVRCGDRLELGVVPERPPPPVQIPRQVEL